MPDVIPRNLRFKHLHKTASVVLPLPVCGHQCIQDIPYFQIRLAARVWLLPLVYREPPGPGR